MLIVHAYIEVTDLARGIEFYCEGLGLVLKRQLGPRWVELEGANLPIFLRADRPAVAELGTTKVERDYERHWTPVHLDFIVTDLDGTVARLCSLLTAIEPRWHEVGYGVPQ
jgi:catechol 2,3-dioxygenase-like lactoylglutathione lyase family enzyme